MANYIDYIKTRVEKVLNDNGMNIKDHEQIYHVSNILNIQFVDESYSLRCNGKDLSIVNRDTRNIKILSEFDFFNMLNIFVEMEKLRIKRIELRKVIMYDNLYKEYSRDIKIGSIIN